MAATYTLSTPAPDLQILTCHRGQRLVAHIVQRGTQHEARIWPADILIGTYTTLDQAVSAIGETCGGYDLNGGFSDLTVRDCGNQYDYVCLFDRMEEIIDHHRALAEFDLC